MSDATGHMDRSGVDPVSTDEFVGGIPTNHYTRENLQTGRAEVVKINRPGTPDEVVKEFSDRTTARLWLMEEWLAGRLR
jgi:hypothetical protein